MIYNITAVSDPLKCLLKKLSSQLMDYSFIISFTLFCGPHKTQKKPKERKHLAG